jgi:hypothetical protein
MTRQDILNTVKDRVVYAPKEDYYDEPYTMAYVVFCGKTFSDYGDTQSQALNNLLVHISNWLDDQKQKDVDRKLDEQKTYQKEDENQLQEYLRKTK